MNGRDLVRRMSVVGSGWAARGLRSVPAAWRGRRVGAAGAAPRGPERARVPGRMQDVEPGPGGGLLRFARSELRIVVAVNGAVFWGWDGAGPLPSHAIADSGPDPDPRAVLEPDKDGGWRVVAERMTVVVSRYGAVEVRTPGGVLLRRELPPRWWEPAGGGAARWVQRSEVAADARFFGLGGRAGGPLLRDGVHRLGDGVAGRAPGRGDERPEGTVPVQLVVADVGTHLVFHDTASDGNVLIGEGEEGAGSGHDRSGHCELRMDGGPLRCWVVVGTPARVLHGWASLSGAPALPPAWALGHQHAGRGANGEREVRRIVGEYRERGLPLDVVHLDPDGAGDPGASGGEESAAGLAEELRGAGIRLVSVVGAGIPTDGDDGGCGGGTNAAARVRGPEVPEGRGRIFVGVRPDGAGAASPPYAPDGRGGERPAVRGGPAPCVARADWEALRELSPGEPAFRFSRSARAGSQRYGGTWSETGVTGWPGLRASLSQVLGLGLCGVPYSGPDLGGGDGDPSPELYLRWLQLGAYLPLFRTDARPGAGCGEPGEFGAEVLEHARGALLERRRLLPYFLTLAHLARRTGAPYARPLWWAAPEDRALRDCEDAFLLGDDLLVAPVLEAGARRRSVRLPRGRWYDTVTEEAYEGPAQVVVEAPLSRTPVLARAGAVLPVRGAGGGLELEAWAPARGRTGGGLVVPDADGGRDAPGIERCVARRHGDRVVVTLEGEDGAGEPPWPVRVRGLG
ncbi:glycoside hydrolase family 31 protein [Streptomyces sp. NPDC100445]|uniref:glycoside hydrolase family 31 protein n=1 Tax=Streptomyces sp. NPDC100445 TaxID=3366102 RepID=UPI00381E53C9